MLPLQHPLLTHVLDLATDRDQLDAAMFRQVESIRDLDKLPPRTAAEQLYKRLELVFVPGRQQIATVQAVLQVALEYAYDVYPSIRAHIETALSAEIPCREEPTTVR